MILAVSCFTESNYAAEIAQAFSLVSYRILKRAIFEQRPVFAFPQTFNYYLSATEASMMSGISAFQRKLVDQFIRVLESNLFQLPRGLHSIPIVILNNP